MKKVLCLLVTLMMLAFVFTACANQGAAAPEESAQTASAAPVESAEPTPPEEVTIQLFHGKREAQEVFASIIEKFNEQYPHITVEQECVTNDSTAVLKSRIATGETPDIMSCGTDVMEIAKAGYLVNLTDEAFLGNISPQSLGDSTFTDADGQTWALPMDGSFIGIFYNKQIFADNGLSVPRTITELRNVCDTLTTNGVTPFALAFKDAWTIKMASISIFSPAVYGQNLSWDIQRNAGEVTFADTSAWKTSFELLDLIYENGNTDTAFDTDYNGSTTMFAKEEAAMLAQGLWALEPIRQVQTDLGLEALDIGVMGMPVSEDQADAKLHLFPDFSLSISADSAHIEACKEFFAFLTTKEIADMWSNNAKLFSPVKGVAPEFDPIVGDVNTLIEEGRICPQGDRGWPTSFGAEFEKVLPEYLLGQMDVDQVLNTLDTQWDNALAAQGE